MRGHLLHQPQRADHVVVVVRKRLLEGFGDRFGGGKVAHRADLVAAKGPFKRCAIAHIALDQGDIAVGGAPQRGDRRRRAVGEVVQHHHVVIGVQQRRRGVAADVAGAARDEDRAGAHATPDIIGAKWKSTNSSAKSAIK